MILPGGERPLSKSHDSIDRESRADDGPQALNVKEIGRSPSLKLNGCGGAADDRWFLTMYI